MIDNKRKREENESWTTIKSYITENIYCISTWNEKGDNLKINIKI